MKTKKDICLLKFNNVGRNNTLYTDETNFKLPKESPVTVEFNNEKVVGKANNFRKEKDGIYCDLTFNGRATNAYPELIIDTIEEVGDILYPQNCNLNSVSIGFVEHSQKELVGNLK